MRAVRDALVDHTVTTARIATIGMTKIAMAAE